MSAETYVVSGGRPAHEHDAPVNPPIILSSTYRGAGTVDTVSDKGKITATLLSFSA